MIVALLCGPIVAESFSKYQHSDNFRTWIQAFLDPSLNLYSALRVVARS
jgi:hypothetical protein